MRHTELNGLRENGPTVSWTRKAAAYAVHIYTGSGLFCALMASLALLEGDHRQTFAWLVLAFLIDASDGTLARKLETKNLASAVDGRKLDDIVDYLNYTFVPLLLLAGTDWLPRPGWLWVGIALVASAFAFSNTGAKEEDRGFFLGFPSYWNVFVFYTAIFFRFAGAWFVLGFLLFLSALTVLPVRFVYPSHSPRWKAYFVTGGLVWLILVSIILLRYSVDQRIPPAILWTSLFYPLSYILLSPYLDWWSRRKLPEKP